MSVTSLLDKLKQVDIELTKVAVEFGNKAILDRDSASVDIVAGYLERASEAGILLAEAMVHEKTSTYALELLTEDFERNCKEFKRAYIRWKVLCP